jgi:hypothetical protein
MKICLKRQGWYYKCQGKGSHEKWAKEGVNFLFVFNFESKDPHTNTFQRECRDCGIDWECYDDNYYKRVFLKGNGRKLTPSPKKSGKV